MLSCVGLPLSLLRNVLIRDDVCKTFMKLYRNWLRGSKQLNTMNKKEGEERFAEHRNTVTQDYHQGTTKPVGAHFQEPGHSVAEMRFTPIEKIQSKNIFVRKCREKRLINQLDLIRLGLNRKL